MKLFITYLVSFSLLGIGTTKRPLWEEDKVHRMEFEKLHTTGRGLRQEVENETSEGRATNEACSRVILGVDLNTQEGTNLYNLTTRTASECCEACQTSDSCTTWIRNRESGLCALFDIRRRSFTRSVESRFDLGSLSESEAEPENVLRRTIVRRETVREPDLESTPADGPEASCAIIVGATYPDGNVLAEGTANSSYCCDLCRTSESCNSWYHDSRNSGCVMNRNTPDRVTTTSSRFTGGSTSSAS